MNTVIIDDVMPTPYVPKFSKLALAIKLAIHCRRTGQDDTAYYTNNPDLA